MIKQIVDEGFECTVDNIADHVAKNLRYVDDPKISLSRIRYTKTMNFLTIPSQMIKNDTLEFVCDNCDDGNSYFGPLYGSIGNILESSMT